MERQMLLQREESQSSPGRSNAVTRRWGGSRHISHWDAEDLVAWEAGNKRIARRNLLWSVVTVHLGYSVWTLWPVLVLFMPTSAAEEFYRSSAGSVCPLRILPRLKLHEQGCNSGGI